MVWMISILSLISSPSSLFSRSLGTFPSVPTTIGITVTLTFHSFFKSLARSKNFSIFSLSFILSLWSFGTTKSFKWQIIFFLLIQIQNLVFGWDWVIRVYLKIRENYIRHIFWTDSGLCLYYLSARSNLNLLHSSQWITVPVYLYLF